MSKRLPLYNFVLQPAENQCAPFGTKGNSMNESFKGSYHDFDNSLSVSFLSSFLPLLVAAVTTFGCRCVVVAFTSFWLLLSHLLVVAFTSFWLPPILQMWTMYYCRVRLLDKRLHLCDQLLLLVWKKEIRRPSIFVLKLVGTNSFNRFLFFGK